MKNLILCLAVCAMLVFTAAKQPAAQWESLFDGKTLNGWKVGANASTFSVENGMIVAHGPTAHLFYEGDVQQHNFRNFEFKASVMTTPGSNSGIYFHTTYQDSSWPKKGYEVQVNNSHTDWRRTGSLYGIADVKEVFVKDLSKNETGGHRFLVVFTKNSYAKLSRVL